MLDGPGAEGKVDGPVMGGSCVSRAGPAGGAGILAVGMKGEAILEGLAGGRRGSSGGPRMG